MSNEKIGKDGNEKSANNKNQLYDEAEKNILEVQDTKRIEIGGGWETNLGRRMKGFTKRINRGQPEGSRRMGDGHKRSRCVHEGNAWDLKFLKTIRLGKKRESGH